VRVLFHSRDLRQSDHRNYRRRAPKASINVYGETKLAIEQLLESTCKTRKFSAVCLRNFNAAGASSEASIGEPHEPATRLIPSALRAASGTGQPLAISGDDYPPPDGTCIREYLHVKDLADVHLKVMDYLQKHSETAAFDPGNGQEFSVKEVFAACEAAAGANIPHTVGAGREDDPVILVADAARARNILQWHPYATDITDIVGSAWR
jgi:UDP-glucose 4-epimerase